MHYSSDVCRFVYIEFIAIRIDFSFSGNCSSVY